jgi:hypothetical protein
MSPFPAFTGSNPTPPQSMKRLTLVIAVLVAMLAVPAAEASTKQVTILQDDVRLRHDTAATLDEFAALGADVVKIGLSWEEVAPDGRRKPSGFDGSDPAAYNWGNYPQVIDAISARGMQPFVNIVGLAPTWASKRGGRRGTNRPSSKEYGLFVEAVGKQLPNVDLWSLWNEPNLYSWLSPQRRSGTPVSPSIYRNLYVAGHAGLERSGHDGDTILLGELMPRGGTSSKKIPPLDFLREMVCLDRNFRQYRGAAARKRGCKKVGRIPTSGLAYHPYTLANGPSVREPVAGDAAIGQLSRVTRTLDALARRGKLPRRTPIWITEFGYQTKPPDPFATPIKRAAGLMDESEWIAYRNSRVSSYSQYTLRDAPSWQAGLRFANGRKKQGVYEAFAMPLHLERRGGGRVEVFGAARTASSGDVEVEFKANRRASYRSLGSVPVNSVGYFRRNFRVQAGSGAAFRVSLGEHSRAKKLSAR